MRFNILWYCSHAHFTVKKNTAHLFPCSFSPLKPIKPPTRANITETKCTQYGQKCLDCEELKRAFIHLLVQNSINYAVGSF